MNGRTARGALALIVALYLILGTAYSLVNPIFESPDEALNYANIRFFVEEQRLPVLEPDEVSKAHHPPLYYVLGALLTFWVPNEHFDYYADRCCPESAAEGINPFWAYQLGRPGVDNKSRYLRDPDREAFPYRDVALGVHLVRWFSLLMGAGTVLLVYGTARELFPRRPALAVGAAALVAFNPMFLFISASVHDDPLANLVAAALLYTTARLLVRGPTVRQAVALGLLLGLAILTKLTCLLVAPTVGLALLYGPLAGARHPRGRAGWRTAVKMGGIVIGLALLLGGWWFVRNLLLYGEPTSMVRQTGTWGVRENAPDVVAAVRELGFMHDSSWGVFGYGQIPLPGWTYGAIRFLSVVALGGLLLFVVRRLRGHIPWDLPPAVFLILGSVLLVVLAVNFARMTVSAAADFGRYLFISLAVLAPAYALGLGEWSGKAFSWLTLGLVAVLLALAVYALIGVLGPAYASPVMLSQEQLQARGHPADLRFGDAIRLVGYGLDRNRVLPGEDVTVTLCWEALGPMERDYVYFVHVLGPEESKVGARDTHPGLGRYPTNRWKVGDAFCDDVRVPVETWAPAPAVYDIVVGWYLYEGDGIEEWLPAYGPDDAPLELVTLDRIKVAPRTYEAIEVPIRVDADLGGRIMLLGYDIDEQVVIPGQEVDVTLYWMAQVPVSADYTVFVHLAAPDGPPYAQHDSQPQYGAYPTSFWDVGEVVPDPHTVSIPADLPPGDYPLVVGMYVLETGERLSTDAVWLTGLELRLEPDGGAAP